MKNLFFIGLLVAILILPGIAAAEEFTVGEPRDTEGIEVGGAPINWTNLWYETVTPVRCLNTQSSFGFIPSGSYVSLRMDTACGIPFPAAKAVHINMAVFNATGMGNLRAYAYGDSLPFAATLNYGQIPGLFAISNAAIIPLCGQIGCAYDIRFWVSRGCNFIVDVMGYFF
jgi:hypothetical protein